MGGSSRPGGKRKGRVHARLAPAIGSFVQHLGRPPLPLDAKGSVETRIYPSAMLGRCSSRYRTIGQAPDDVFEMTV